MGSEETSLWDALGCLRFGKWRKCSPEPRSHPQAPCWGLAPWHRGGNRGPARGSGHDREAPCLGGICPPPHATPEPLRSGPAASRLAAWAWGLGWWSLEGPPELQLCPRCTHLWSCKRPLKEEEPGPVGRVPPRCHHPRMQTETDSAKVTLTLEPVLSPLRLQRVEDAEGLNPGGHVPRRVGASGEQVLPRQLCRNRCPEGPHPSVLWMTTCPPLLTPEPSRSQS